MEPTYPRFQEWQQSVPPAVCSDKKMYWITPKWKVYAGGRTGLLGASTCRRHPMPTGRDLGEFNPAMQERLLEHLRLLKKKGYIAEANKTIQSETVPGIALSGASEKNAGRFATSFRGDN